MASKKYTLLIGLLCLIASATLAQTTGGSYNWKDSSVIPAKRLPQHQEFLNNNYAFPAKPRNQWEIGISAGAVTLSSDVSSKFPTLGLGIAVKKALGYVFSLRAEYFYGTAKGQNWVTSYNYQHNTAWANSYNGPELLGNGPNGEYILTGTVTGAQQSEDFDPVFYNYRTTINEAAIEGVFTLNNIRFHKNKTGLILYALAGIGGMTYDTKVDALNGSGNPYDYSQIANANVYKSRKDVRKALKNLQDGKYETRAENHGTRRPKLFGNTFKPIGTVGFGIAYKISKRFNIGLEEKISWTNDDLLDGQRWQENPIGDAAQTRDFDSYHYTSLRLNYNLGAKSVEPLWWLNPLDYAYNELNRPQHMLFPKPVLPDADGDAVTDQFDNEPNTPQGCPVDSHGVSLDTDGDGVPDCKDKEKITPTYCQPVDADGVGKCPCPDSTCFKDLVGVDKSCRLGYVPPIVFKKNSDALSDDAKSILTSLGGMLKVSENCKIKVVGHPLADKRSQARNQKRIDAVVKYLVETQGITADRVEAVYDGGAGDENTVDIISETIGGGN
jgi:OmpA-OmpF porin, OOP family